MPTETFDQYATPRLNAISEELHEINTEIIANIEVLPEKTELVRRLIGKCDDISLELDAIRLELRSSSGVSSNDAAKNPDPSADGSGLRS